MFFPKTLAACIPLACGGGLSIRKFNIFLGKCHRLGGKIDKTIVSLKVKTERSYYRRLLIKSSRVML